jgi:hypothetical protein
MPRARPAPRRRTTTIAATASTSRRINPADVDRAADSLLRAGQRPTIEKVRATIGRGEFFLAPRMDHHFALYASAEDAFAERGSRRNVDPTRAVAQPQLRRAAARQSA